MSSTITPQSLTVTVSESINLNNQAINSENQLVIAEVNEYDKRIMELPTGSEVTIISFSAAVAAGTFVRGDMKYFRVANKDTVNYARIRIKKNGADAADFKLDAGKFLMMGNAKLNTSDTAGTFVTFEDVDSISGQAYDGAISIEYVVAST